MWDKNSKRYHLGIQASGHNLYERARLSVYNSSNGKLEIHGFAIGGQDVEMIYDLYLSRRDERKPTKEQISFVIAFILGIAEGSDQRTRLTGNGLPGRYSH